MGTVSYHVASHCKYLTQYHIIWCPKFRYSILNDKRSNLLKKILLDICNQYHYTIKAMEVMPDNIHLFIDAPHTIAPCDIVRTLKSISAIRMLDADPSLRKFYASCWVLWSTGYFISTVGHIRETVVQRYIEDQKHGKNKTSKI